ncbi:MAG TPA: enoyl-CoA hydratase-related protein [Rubricoccaceae bacterium]|jgi:methylglutaconyl-CoA hydratase
MLQTRRDGPVLTLTLDRPETRNALSADLVEALTTALADAAEDAAVRVVVIAAAGKVFSAGADLAALRALRDASFSDNLADSERLGRLFEAILRHPKPVVARVHGHAIAGGCGLAAACDLSLVAESATLGFSEVRIGFVPALVATFVTRRIGETAARELFLRGHRIPACEAARIGLVTRVVPDAALDAELAALCTELATETSGSAIALTKALLADLPGRSLADALAHAAAVNAHARATDDCRAGVDAFLGKTDPPWRAAAG